MVKAINRMAKSTRRSNSPVLREAVLEWIDRMKPDYDATAKYIWENPELSLVEYRSSARLMGWLKKNGFQVKAGICGMDTAFVASSGSGKPVIGFLAEYDALPNLSQQPGCAVDFRLGRSAAEAQAQRGLGRQVRESKRPQDIGGLG